MPGADTASFRSERAGRNHAPTASPPPRPEALDRLQAQISGVFLGKPEVVKLALVALLADGHLLLEDVPGVGKTLLAKALARSLGCRFTRVQFTPDLLPGDLIGTSVFQQQIRRVRVPAGAGVHASACSRMRSTGPRRAPSRRCSRR